MSALAALKGYRTQFLYSLYYILKHQDENYKYHLEGTEDLDVLNGHGQIQYYIQVKNLSKPITLSDLIAEKGTSFIRRYLANQGTTCPVLVSFGQISDELKLWEHQAGSILAKEKPLLQKYKISEADFSKVKTNLKFEQVNETGLLSEIYELLKGFNCIDPVPTLENLLYWTQYIAEKQAIITFKDVFEKIESIAIYLSERIAITKRYGIYIKALHQIDLSLSSVDKLAEEYYYGINARYEHILANQDVSRIDFLNEIKTFFEQNNTVIIHGASGQGKSSLAYRYAHDNAPGSLIYEILLQEDAVATSEAILALHAITKKLIVPILLIINVAPNTVSWVKIIEATSAFSSLNFLVTIRNEDWFRAKSSDIRFSFSELELNLAENEAELIYKELSLKRQQTRYIDFKEAWLDLGQKMPLMEFTYAITQGESLRNRLQQQVLLLNQEEQSQKATGQLDFLRLISLADYFGARINVSKLKMFPGIQFIIQKFEREYLLKQVDDKKYITGLHPIRSKLLCDLLFDEFIVTRKSEIVKCLEVIEDADAYPFLLRCFYEDLFSTDELISMLQKRQNITWIFFSAVIKSLLWAGTNGYLKTNKHVFDEAYQAFGDAWLMLLDIYHHSNIDVHQIMSSLGTDAAKLAYIDNLNAALSPKSKVFDGLVLFFEHVSPPSEKPQSVAEWLGFAETLFWSSNVPHGKTISTINVSDEDFNQAFASLNVDVLAKLMLGMHFYSNEYDVLRLKNSSIFIKKLREKYLIPHLHIGEEVTVNYILDIINETESFSVHDHVLEVIDLIRDAFPDKKKYNTQAHGHRNNIIQLPFDDSKKGISSENLLLEEWSNLNATLRKLYEYSHRPDDWTDFLDRLQNWETSTKQVINGFNDAFAELKRTNGARLVTVVEQCNYDYGHEIKSPKSIADPFGLHIKSSKSKSERLNLISGALKEHILTERHQLFFKSFREYKNNLENFIKQSGQAVYQLLNRISNPLAEVNDQLLYISQINLFDAIVHRGEYVVQKKRSFKNLHDLKNAELSEVELLNTATIWKGFLTALPTNNFKNLALKERITVIKNDFEGAIIKSLRKLSKESGYNMRYLNNSATNSLPIFFVDAPTSAEAILAVSYCYGMVKHIINEPEYNSLKQLMLLRYFDALFIVPLINGNTFNHNWYKFRWHAIRDTQFQDLKLHNLMTYPIPEQFISDLHIGSWIDIYPAINDIYLLHVEYVKMRLMVEHLADLQYFDKIDDLDDEGRQLIVEHMEKICDKLQPSFQYVLDKLAYILELHEFNYLDEESERIYIEEMRTIQKNIFPIAKGDEVNYEAKLDMDVLVGWADRLNNLNESWGKFILILQHKYLQSFTSNDA